MIAVRGGFGGVDVGGGGEEEVIRDANRRGNS